MKTMRISTTYITDCDLQLIWQSENHIFIAKCDIQFYENGVYPRKS